MNELTNQQRKELEVKLRAAEAIQRKAMAASNWEAVWKVQGAIDTLATLLGRDPIVQ